MLVKLTKGHKGLAINIGARAHNLPVEALLLLVLLVLVQWQLHVTTRKAALMLQVLDHHEGQSIIPAFRRFSKQGLQVMWPLGQQGTESSLGNCRQTGHSTLSFSSAVIFSKAATLSSSSLILVL